MLPVTLIDLGSMDYKQTWELQEGYLQEVIAGRLDSKVVNTSGYLLMVEHPHVYTLGKSGTENNLLISDQFLKQIQATFYRINRGGDITYHGPGQLVVYPVLDLDKYGIGVKEYVSRLEDVIIHTVGELGVQCGRLTGATGVWLDADKPSARKICAIGVRVSRSVTMHGFALNVNTDLKYFSYINPCGFQDKGVTSLEKETGMPVSMEKVKNLVKFYFEKNFGPVITL